MAAADLIVQVKAMMDEYLAGVEDAAAQTEEFSGRAGKAWAAVNDHIAEITGATAAAGAALEGFAQSQAGTNEIIEQTAIVTGESSQSLRDMLDDLSNSTNSAGDMAEGMKELVRQGVDTREEMEAILPHMDNFAAATGQSIPDAIDTTRGVLGPLGKDMADAGDEVDAMTHLLRTTDTDLGALRRNLAQVPDELQAMEFGTDDVAAAMEVMIERGFDGEEGVREFRRMVANSKGDFDVLLESLNVTAEEFDSYREKVAESEGITQAFADANADTLTPMQEALQWVQNLGVEYGDWAQTAANLAPALLAVGPAIKGVSLAMSLALGPVGLITAAVAGAAAIAYTLYQNWDEVSALVTGIWESVKIRAEEIWGAITDTVDQFVTDVVTFFTDLKDDSVQLVADMKDAIIEQFTGMFSGAIDTVKGMYDGVVGWFSDLKKEMVDESIVPDMVDDVLEEFGRMRDGSIERSGQMNTGVIEQARTMADNATVIGQELGIGWLQSIGDTVTGSIESIGKMKKIITGGEDGKGLLGNMAEVGTTIGRLWAGDWTAVMDLFKGDTIGKISDMVSQVIGLMEDLWGSIQNIAGKVFDVVGDIGGAIGDVAGDVVDVGGDIVGGAVDAVGDVVSDVGDFFGFQHGGIVTRPTMGLVAEAGQSEAVIPLDRLPDLVGEMTGGGMHVTINQHINGATPGEIEAQTRRALRQYARQWNVA